MFKIDGTTIHLTRGDACIISVGANIFKSDGTKTPHEFVDGDVISFAIYDKKKFDKSPILLKEVINDSNKERINIPLNSSDTKIGDILNKPHVYWYEIQLNHNQTLIGFDNDGAKEFILYPEGADPE